MSFMCQVLLISNILTLLACGNDRKEDSHLKENGLVGTTCYSHPLVKDTQGRNTCITPQSNWPSLSAGEFWYSIFLAGVARKATVQSCKDANALDYGVKFGKSCFHACEEAAVTSCIPMTPNHDI
jgi:hypothetical protein